MTQPINPKTDLVIRPLQYRDLEAIESLVATACATEDMSCSVALSKHLKQMRRWYGLLKVLCLFPNPFQHNLCVYIAEKDQQILGLIQVKPFNATRTTWKVERVLLAKEIPASDSNLAPTEVGSQLLRYCLEKIWEARTWVLEVNIHDKDAIALYRHNGFQPVANMTYWVIPPELATQLAQHHPDLPNLLPVSNADAQLIYQLDTVSMPPLLRQVFDRHVHDFKISLSQAVVFNMQQWLSTTEVIRSYVFETQRKAAIGYFQLQSCRNGSQPHTAELTVHPAYTYLYPQLLAQMAQIVQALPPQALQLASADYQPEREEYLEKLGAHRTEHTILMSRSVWHKLKEAKPLEGLQLSEVLQSLQPARTPIPSRISWWKMHSPFHHHDFFEPQKNDSVNNSANGKSGSLEKPPESS